MGYAMNFTKVGNFGKAWNHNYHHPFIAAGEGRAIIKG